MENAEEEAEKSCPGFQQLLACVLLKPEAEEASFHSIPLPPKHPQEADSKLTYVRGKHVAGGGHEQEPVD
jgi:hypothetical protein